MQQNHALDSDAPWVLVTGASSRLGVCLVEYLLQNGFAVAMHAHRNAHMLCDSTEGSARRLILHGDFTDTAAVAAMFATMAQQNIVPCVLINNASLFEHDSFTDFTLQNWDDHMRVNALAPALLMRAFIAHAAARAVQIINITDAKLHAPNPDDFTYTLSKTVLDTMARLLAVQYAGSNIRINTVAPGPFLPSTQLSAQQLHDNQTLFPTKQHPRIDDIIAAIGYFLVQPNLHGVTLCVDGGLHLRHLPRDIAFYPQM